MTLTIKINRKVKGTHTFFFPTINGKRTNGINYARKYDAVGRVKSILDTYTQEEIINKLTLIK